MPDNNLTEDQNQVTQLLRRCKNVHGVFRQAVIYAVLLLVIIGLLSELLWWKGSGVFLVMPFLLYFGFWVITAGIVVALCQKRRKFVRNFTNEEKELLERVAESTWKDDSKIARAMLQIYENIRQDDDKQLLRASAKQEDETLLRAAQYNETAPQEQLLRPTDTAK